MNLPTLPRQNKHKEADFGLVLVEWMKKNGKSIDTSGIEIKDTKGKNYLNFNAVEPQQITYANLASGDKGVLIRVQGLKGEFDYIWMKNELAYVAIRYPKFWCIILTADFMIEKQISKSKSLTAERAKEIAIRVIQT